MSDDNMEFSSDDESRSPDPLPTMTLNPLLYKSAAVAEGNRRPYNSAKVLAPYFGLDNAATLRCLLNDRLGDDFQRTYGAVQGIAKGKRATFPKVQQVLSQARSTPGSSLVIPGFRGMPSWLPEEWIAHFVYHARLALFEEHSSVSHATNTVPVHLRDDRAYAAYLLMSKWRQDHDHAAKKKATRNRAADQGESAASATLDNSEDEPAASPAMSSVHTAQSEESEDESLDEISDESSNNTDETSSGKADDREAAAESALMGPLLDGHVPGSDEDLDRPKGKAHLSKDFVPPSNADTIAQLTFADGFIVAIDQLTVQRLPRPARELRGVEGDDTLLNPLHKHFYQLRGTEGNLARLLGSDHLFDIERTRPVDFQDNQRIDKKNCSSSLIANHVAALTKSDPSAAQQLVDEVEAAARCGDVFALKHLKILRPTSTALHDNLNQVIGEMFPAQPEFAKSRFKLLEKCSEYHKKSAHLRSVMGAAIVTEDMTVKISEANANENSVVLDPKEVTGDMPTRSRRHPSSSDTEGGKLVAIDTDDAEWRERQKLLLGAFVSPPIRQSEYRNALSKLHIERRSVPLMPGQNGETLLWSQSVAIAKSVEMALQRMRNNRGPVGICLGDSTGLGKSNIAVGTILGVNNERAFDLNALRQAERFDRIGMYARNMPARVHLWITDSHLVTQAAEDIHRFSDTLIVYVYRNERDKAFKLPAGIRQLTERLEIDDALLTNDNPLKAHVVVVMSKGTLASRHGPRAVVDFGRAERQSRSSYDKSLLRTLSAPPSWFPYSLQGQVGIAVIDEAHNIGGEGADAWVAIRWLRASFHCLLTATPVVWAGDKLTALLMVLQDPALDAEAKRLIAGGKLADVYGPGFSLDDPHAKYQATCSAFVEFFDRNATSVEQGRVLALVFRSVMLRRTYQSQCVTHPSGDTHSMADLMPPSLPIRVHVTNNDAVRDVWINESGPAMQKLYHRDRSDTTNTNKLLVNGKFQRILNLGSFCVLLFFATDMHDVGENDTILEYRRLHDNAHYADYLFKVLQNVFQEGVITKGYSHLFPYMKPSNNGDQPAARMPSRSKIGEIVWTFVSRSERIKLILALIADWVGRQGHKVLIWALNPTEQELLNAILNLCGVRSVALLARYSAADKASILDRFKQPLSASSGRATTAVEADSEIEVLIMSVKAGTGTNCQKHCSHMIFTGPAPSDATHCQCCGRIVRVGQSHACVIVEVFDNDSFNMRTFTQAVKHALPVLYAHLNTEVLSQIFSGSQDDDEVGQDTAVLADGLDGFVRLENGNLAKESSLQEDDLLTATRLGPNEVLTAIYAQLNARSYQATRDADNVVQLSQTSHVAEARSSVPNTPQKLPGVRGQRAYQHRTLEGMMEEVDSLQTDGVLTKVPDTDRATGSQSTRVRKSLKRRREAVDDVAVPERLAPILEDANMELAMELDFGEYDIGEIVQSRYKH